jgi:hypothetical protein
MFSTTVWDSNMLDRMNHTFSQVLDVPLGADRVVALFSNPIKTANLTVESSQNISACAVIDGKIVTAVLSGNAPAATRVHFQCEY